jgi:hypothetical protein
MIDRDFSLVGSSGSNGDLTLHSINRLVNVKFLEGK